jgi:hypothetical protein
MRIIGGGGAEVENFEPLNQNNSVTISVLKTWLEDRISWYIFHGFPQSIQARTGIVPKFGHNHFHEYNFPIHYPSDHSTVQSQTPSPNRKQINKQKFYILGYNAVESVRNRPKFRRNESHPKRQIILHRLHGVISQKTELITIAVRTSCPANK